MRKLPYNSAAIFMTDSQTLTEAALGLKNDWGMQLPDTFSEETILQLLAQRIAGIIERGAEPFYQLMYRLDIPEKQLAAMERNGNVAYEVAKLVYKRQLQKVQSRKENRMSADNADPELKW